MSAYVKWMAQRYEDLSKDMTSYVRERRVGSDMAAHQRIPTNVANLQFGLQTFMKFAVDIGALNAQEVSQLSHRVVRAMEQVAQAQATHQREADPVVRFFGLLRAVMATGEAYVVAQERPPARVRSPGGGAKAGAMEDGANRGRAEMDPEVSTLAFG